MSDHSINIGTRTNTHTRAPLAVTLTVAVVVIAGLSLLVPARTPPAVAGDPGEWYGTYRVTETTVYNQYLGLTDGRIERSLVVNQSPAGTTWAVLVDGVTEDNDGPCPGGDARVVGAGFGMNEVLLSAVYAGDATWAPMLQSPPSGYPEFTITSIFTNWFIDQRNPPACESNTVTTSGSTGITSIGGGGVLTGSENATALVGSMVHTTELDGGSVVRIDSWALRRADCAGAPDTDGDGFDDCFEVDFGSSPFDESSLPGDDWDEGGVPPGPVPPDLGGGRPLPIGGTEALPIRPPGQFAPFDEDDRIAQRPRPGVDAGGPGGKPAGGALILTAGYSYGSAAGASSGKTLARLSAAGFDLTGAQICMRATWTATTRTAVGTSINVFWNGVETRSHTDPRLTIDVTQESPDVVNANVTAVAVIEECRTGSAFMTGPWIDSPTTLLIATPNPLLSLSYGVTFTGQLASGQTISLELPTRSITGAAGSLVAADTVVRVVPPRRR